MVIFSIDSKTSVSYTLAMNKGHLKLETIPFTLALSKMKYLDIYLMKYIQNLYEENCKSDEKDLRKTK